MMAPKKILYGAKGEEGGGQKFLQGPKSDYVLLINVDLQFFTEIGGSKQYQILKEGS